jgi:hypothetical protein
MSIAEYEGLTASRWVALKGIIEAEQRAARAASRRQ